MKEYYVVYTLYDTKNKAVYHSRYTFTEKDYPNGMMAIESKIMCWVPNVNTEWTRSNGYSPLINNIIEFDPYVKPLPDDGIEKEVVPHKKRRRRKIKSSHSTSDHMKLDDILTMHSENTNSHFIFNYDADKNKEVMVFDDIKKAREYYNEHDSKDSLVCSNFIIDK